ncbi:T3SS secreted effector EspM-like protein [Escherichia coli]|nr:T3SS secreted effector EspM-like protein [Escherichia coli]
MMSLWDALRMNMMISYQELVRTFLSFSVRKFSGNILETVRRQSTKDIDEWIKDERIVYPSRVINQEIDNYCFQKMQKFPLKRGKESFFL